MDRLMALVQLFNTLRRSADAGSIPKLNRLGNAVKGNSIEAVKLLLDNGDDVNVSFEPPDEDGSTPLMAVSITGHIGIAKLLLSRGANVNMMDKKENRSALMYACENGKTDIVKVLVESGAQVDLRNRNGYTALMAASLKGHRDIAEFLMRNGAEVNMQDDDGLSALLLASVNGHTDVAEMLIGNGATVNLQTKDGQSALILASMKGYKNVAEVLIVNGAGVNIQNNEGQSPLIIAANNGYPDFVKVLIEKGADVNLVSRCSDADHEKELQGEVTSAGRASWSALMYASNAGHTEITKLLVENGANINLQSTMGFSALFMACTQGHASIVRILLDHNCDTTLREGFFGLRAIDMASQKGHIDIMNMLLQYENQRNVSKREQSGQPAGESSAVAETPTVILLDETTERSCSGVSFFHEKELESESNEGAEIDAGDNMHKAEHEQSDTIQTHDELYLLHSTTEELRPHELITAHITKDSSTAGSAAASYAHVHQLLKCSNQPDIAAVSTPGAYQQPGPLTLDDITQHVDIQKELLEKECSDKHLTEIGSLISDQDSMWSQCAVELKLTQSKISDIRLDPGLTIEMKARKMLELWHTEQSFKATYRCLVCMCLKMKQGKIATEICKILKRDSHVPECDVSTRKQNDEHVERESSVPPKAKRRRLMEHADTDQI